MRSVTMLFLLFAGHYSVGQDKNILQHKKHFDLDLKQWTKSFNNFNLSDFIVEDTLQFENNFQQDIKSYKKFLSIYKPIITYSTDSSEFIDIYSYQLNLEKKGSYYEANIELDLSILLCDLKTKYWNRIYFGTGSQWIYTCRWEKSRLL